MKRQLNNYSYKLQKTFRSRQVFVTIIAVLLVLAAVLFRINALNNIPVNQKYLDAQSSKLQSVRFNEEAVTQIKALNESSAQDPGTQLPTGRQNPFNE